MRMYVPGAMLRLPPFLAEFVASTPVGKGLADNAIKSIKVIRRTTGLKRTDLMKLKQKRAYG